MYLFQNDLFDAHATIKSAIQYNVPENNHNASALHEIIALRQGERETAQDTFMKSIAQADEILTKTPDYYSALDAKGLALCGLALTQDLTVLSSEPSTSGQLSVRPVRSDTTGHQNLPRGAGDRALMQGL